MQKDTLLPAAGSFILPWLHDARSMKLNMQII